MNLHDQILAVFVPNVGLITGEIVARLEMAGIDTTDYGRIHRAIQALWNSGKLRGKLSQGKRRYYLP